MWEYIYILFINYLTRLATGLESGLQYKLLIAGLISVTQKKHVSEVQINAHFVSSRILLANRQPLKIC